MFCESQRKTSAGFYPIPDLAYEVVQRIKNGFPNALLGVWGWVPFAKKRKWGPGPEVDSVELIEAIQACFRYLEL